jgi:hypothetical protein
MDEKILDHPERPGHGDYSQRIWSHRLNTMDYLINLILIGIVALGGLAGLIDKGGLFISLIALFGLGVYQLGRGLIGAIRGNRDKLRYLLSALAFITGSVLIGYLLEGRGIDDQLGFILFFAVLLVSFAGACYYTLLCYRAKQHTAL